MCIYIVSTGCPNKNHRRNIHVLHFHPGLTQQREWQSKPDELSASVFPSWLETCEKWQRMISQWLGHERWSPLYKSTQKKADVMHWEFLFLHIFLTFAGCFSYVFLPRLSPFSLWDPTMNATFSSSVNDGVIERLLAMLEVKGPGTFVEIGALKQTFLRKEQWVKHG